MPAAAVRRRVQALSGFTGRKESRRRFFKSVVKASDFIGERRLILKNLCWIGGAGIPSGGVKSVEIGKNTESEGRHLGPSDADERKLREQKGLETPVVLAVNDAY